MKTKRLLLLLTLTTCLSGAAFGQTRGVERQRYLNGAVQSLEVESGNLISLVGVGNSRPYVSSRRRQLDYLFDQKGNLAETIRYDLDGKAFQRDVLKYDDKGRLLEEMRFVSKDLPVERLTHRYDAEGRRSESLRYDENGKQTGKIGYRYDSAGRLIEKLSYIAEMQNGKAVFGYDEAGRESSFIAYNSKGDIPNQIISQYDDKANSVQRSRSGLKGDLEGTTVTTYNTKGDVTVILHHRPNGSPAWKWEFEYDDKGNVIKEQFANKASLSVWVYAYEYDSMGNWTKKSRSQLFDDRGKLTPYLSGITFRSFKYYSKTNITQAIPEPQEPGVVKDAVLSMTASEIRPLNAGAALASTHTPDSLGRPIATGTLQVEMTIDIEGNVEAAKVISGGDMFSGGPGELERKMMKRTYKPVLLNGVPVKVVDTMSFKFEVQRPGRGKW